MSTRPTLCRWCGEEMDVMFTSSVCPNTCNASAKTIRWAYLTVETDPHQYFDHGALVRSIYCQEERSFGFANIGLEICFARDEVVEPPDTIRPIAPVHWYAVHYPDGTFNKFYPSA